MVDLAVVSAAEALARRAHAGQVRRGSNAPYICHPEAVVRLLQEWGVEDPVVLAAGWCHDVLEDAPAGMRDEARYEVARLGSEVFRIVGLLTKDYPKGDKEAEAGYWARIHRDPAAAMIKVADRISNLRDGMVLDAKWKYRYLADTADHFFGYSGQPAHPGLREWPSKTWELARRALLDAFHQLAQSHPETGYHLAAGHPGPIGTV